MNQLNTGKVAAPLSEIEKLLSLVETMELKDEQTVNLLLLFPPKSFSHYDLDSDNKTAITEKKLALINAVAPVVVEA